MPLGPSHITLHAHTASVSARIVSRTRTPVTTSIVSHQAGVVLSGGACFRVKKKMPVFIPGP